MSKYKVTVNGKEYEVEVEQIGADPVVTAAAPKAAAPAAPVKKAAPAAQGTVGNVKINAPMPGTILGVKVSVGDKVEKGATLLILEAMKMENEIAAPEAGTVSSINVEAGASVESGQLLASLS
ncbi:MAG TPA: biotin/lipoyl-binding protein [Clostridia bacterium]|nr:biotin/lipoyl-binding protein [Clostridia bacterium]HPQ47435.1 biotin/lipoyl-binding protein [Clostridia bacterium]HRX43199.1 biotin/lipoyl-binding protein [Clostridia bacterium]